jgi:hypothetical protein
LASAVSSVVHASSISDAIARRPTFTPDRDPCLARRGERSALRYGPEHHACHPHGISDRSIVVARR